MTDAETLALDRAGRFGRTGYTSLLLGDGGAGDPSSDADEPTADAGKIRFLGFEAVSVAAIMPTLWCEPGTRLFGQAKCLLGHQMADPAGEARQEKLAKS